MEELKTTKQSNVSWPSPQDYNEAVQNPAQSFQDPDLQQAQAETDGLGLPRPYTGMFASVYEMKNQEGKTWALRCFLQYVPDLVERYALITKALQEHNLASTIQFDMQEQGVLVKGQWFPILKMAWCKGDTLDAWLEDNLHNREALDIFQERWKELILSLRNAGIAHGDLQHGNIIVENVDNIEIKLVDYDGMYVHGMQGRSSNELGHRAYQHPSRSRKEFGSELDNFSSWVIYIAVEVLKHDPALWDKLYCGDDRLLLHKKDLDYPNDSRRFYYLEKHANEEIKKAARLLRYLLSLSIDEIPPLDMPPRVPDDLPNLTVPPLWYEQTEVENLAALLHELEEAEDEETLLRRYDQGPISPKGKRPRSRTKGGYSGSWRPGGRAQDDEAQSRTAAHSGESLSPLAQLVRYGKTGVSSGQLLNLAAPGSVPAQSTSAPNQVTGKKKPSETLLVLGVVIGFFSLIFVGQLVCSWLFVLWCGIFSSLK